MSGVQVTVDATQILAALARLQAAAHDLRPALDRLGVAFVSRIRGTFEQQADPYGRAWPGLKPSTLRRRRMKGAGAQILRDTNRLMNSITHVTGENEVTIGATDVEYAAIHQFGGTINRKGKSGSVRLRTTAAGQLTRGSTGGAVFASRRHKRAIERSYEGRDYSISIPARPFFPDGELPADWLAEGVGIVLTPLREAVE